MKLGPADIAMILNVVVIIALVVVLGLLFHNSDQAKKATNNAATTRELAQELRTSSDDLTRFVRTYTVTNNISYFDFYKEVVRIRDGSSRLPVEPWRIWWDLVVATGANPRPLQAAPSSLAERFIAAGFTPEELGYLESSRLLSDALVDIEDVAAHAIKGEYRPYPPGTTGLTFDQRTNYSILAAPNITWARELVHNNAYHHEKGEIMRPLDKFAALSSARVDQELDNINQLNRALLGILGAAVGILIIVMLLFIFKLRKDQETTQILNAVLPAHISSAVSPSDVNMLRAQATAQARMVRRQQQQASASSSTKYVNGVALATTSDPNEDDRFPVLFHEHIPFLFISFMDCVNFTRACRTASCGAIISTLNELFALMDAAAARFRIVKIKTIGDCFMSIKVPRLSAATKQLERESGARGGGIDIREIKKTSKADARNIARCGLDMLRFVFHAFELSQTIALPFMDALSLADLNNRQQKQLFGDTSGLNNDDDLSEESHNNNNPTSNTLPQSIIHELELRAGVAFGACSSGVVGFDKFMYDVFGSTINLAAELESSGRPSHIHVPRDLVFECLTEFIDLIDLVPAGEGGHRKIKLRKGLTVPIAICKNENENDDELFDDNNNSNNNSNRQQQQQRQQKQYEYHESNILETVLICNVRSPQQDANSLSTTNENGTKNAHHNNNRDSGSTYSMGEGTETSGMVMNFGHSSSTVDAASASTTAAAAVGVNNNNNNFARSAATTSFGDDVEMK